MAMTMDVSTRNAIDATLNALAPSASQEVLMQRLQVNLLKRSLDAQKEQAETLMRMVEGKGQNLDIRC
ncbi:MAG: YjfB family protein [Fimbriimonadaceae bacterium]|nr:YjfB family protein [Fimbriimonadaceae bacterium]